MRGGDRPGMVLTSPALSMLCAGSLYCSEVPEAISNTEAPKAYMSLAGSVSDVKRSFIRWLRGEAQSHRHTAFVHGGWQAARQDTHGTSKEAARRSGRGRVLAQVSAIATLRPRLEHTARQAEVTQLEADSDRA